MITNFKISIKTKHPACCAWFCCGNKFGRIEKSFLSRGRKVYPRVHQERIKKTRRYAKHVEKNLIRKMIREEINNEIL